MRKEISKKIQEICTKSTIRNNPKYVIDDMMQLGFNLLAFNSINWLSHTYADVRTNEEFVHELKDYKRDPEAWETLKDAFKLYCQDIKNSEPFTDVIGMQYDEYLGKVLGQFLTPPDVADALCYLHMHDLGEKIERKEQFNIVDPCSGAGALQLGALRMIHREYGKDAIKLAHLYANDIDHHMMKMCSVQILLSSIFHDIPVGSFLGRRSNAITEYDGGGEHVILAIYDVPSFMEYSHKKDSKYDKIPLAA